MAGKVPVLLKHCAQLSTSQHNFSTQSESNGDLCLTQIYVLGYVLGHVLEFVLNSANELCFSAGHLPFDGKDKTNIKNAIAEGRIKSLPSSHSGECIEFVASMLRQNPAQRPSCQELLQHPYVLKHCQQAGPSTPRISDSSPSRMVIDAGSSRGSSTTASGAASALPGSFSVRHNQEAAGASSAGATRSVDMSPVAFQVGSLET